MFISWRPLLVCAASSLLNLVWASSAKIWPPTQVIYKKSATDELGNLISHMIAVPAIPDFYYFIMQSMLWVDKSLLIKTIFEREKGVNKDVIIVTSNPRWGKTMNLNMFAFYCELPTDYEGVPLDREKSPAYKYFANGVIVKNGQDIDKTHPQPPLISSYEGNDEHLANYPVIRLHGTNLIMKDGLSSFTTLISDAYSHHDRLARRLLHLRTYGNASSKHTAEKYYENFNKYYFKSSIMVMGSDELLIGIQKLSEALEFAYNRKVVIVYDEHGHFLDAYFGGTPFQSTPETLNFQKYLEKFMLATFEDNSALEIALITGVLSVHEATYLSNLTNVQKSYIFDYNNVLPFYGIFDWEFQKIMELRGLDEKDFDVQFSLESDGFRSLANLTALMFSAYSVANFISSSVAGVFSYQQIGSVVNRMKKMMNQPAFEAEMVNLVKNLDDTFASISYSIFQSLHLKDCELLNQLMHGVIPYDPDQHRDVMFSHLLNSGLVTVAKDQKCVHNKVDIKIPNREAMDCIKSQIIARHGIDVETMKPAKSALVEFMQGTEKDDSTTFPKLINKIGVYLSEITENEDFGTINEPNFEHTQILSRHHFSNERSLHTLMFYFLFNMFSNIVTLKPTNNYVQYANELIVQRYGSNKSLDTYIEDDNTALIIEYKQGETGDPIDSALKQAIAYGFIYQAYNIRYPVLKFVALRVNNSLYIESQCVTIPTATFRQAFSDWNQTVSQTGNNTFNEWQKYVDKHLVKGNAVVKYECDAMGLPYE